VAELKTKPNVDSAHAFVQAVPDQQLREDCLAVLELMKDVTKADPVMWGESIVGFGNYHYVYDSGREGDWFLSGFSPRKQNLTLYIMAGFDEYDELMQRLGNYKTGKSCLYIKKLSDIDTAVLRSLVEASVGYLRQRGCELVKSKE
jgi:hypothetical protein